MVRDHEVTGVVSFKNGVAERFTRYPLAASPEQAVEKFTEFVAGLCGSMVKNISIELVRPL